MDILIILLEGLLRASFMTGNVVKDLESHREVSESFTIASLSLDLKGGLGY